MNRANPIAFTVLVSVLLVAPPAQAYIDPGTGSMLIQSAIAALIGIAFAFRNGFRMTLRWFAELFRRDDPTPPRDDDAPPPGNEPPAGSGH